MLGFSSIRLDDIDRCAADGLERLANAARELTPTRGLRIVILLSFAAVAIKAGTAIAHPGFFSGDDVEIEEMTLGRLLHRGWPVWSLRSPFYPMLFVYPVQAAIAGAGVSNVGSLVTTARMTVAVLSTLAIPLLYTVVRREHGAGAALAAAVFLTASRLHLAFGSTELPRPVAAVFVLAAFAALARPAGPRAAVAGLLLAVAAAMRFSEAVFAGPAIFQLLWERRVRSAVVLLASFGAARALIQGRVTENRGSAAARDRTRMDCRGRGGHVCGDRLRSGKLPAGEVRWRSPPRADAAGEVAGLETVRGGTRVADGRPPVPAASRADCGRGPGADARSR